MSNKIFLRPQLSEQTYALAQQNGVYVFMVAKSVNKNQVANAVAEQFNVAVRDVNMANIVGKTKRTISLRGQRQSKNGRQSDRKKAYVRLAAGAKLPIFTAIDELQEKEQAAQERIDHSVTKQAKKGTANAGAASKQNRRGLHLFNRQGEK